MNKLKRMITALMLTSLLVAALPSISVAENVNEECPSGSVLIAKFEVVWDSVAEKYTFIFEKGWLNVVEIVGDETGGTWNSKVEILLMIIKAAQVTVFDYSPGGAKSGYFTNAQLENPGGDPPGISNIQFCGPPSTAITLVSFTAAGSAGGVTLTWETGTEVDNAGFNLHRAASADGPWTKINGALIAAQGDPVSGAAYSFVDAPGFGTFFYQLEDVDFFGFTTMHGPVGVTLKSPFRSPNYRPTPPR